MTKNNNKTVTEFLNEIYSDLTNTSKQELTSDEIDTLIEQFKEFDLGVEKLEQLKVFVANQELFGKVDAFSEVKKIVGKVLQFNNMPEINVKKQLFVAICQDAFNEDNKNVKALYANIQCIDPDNKKGLLQQFNDLVSGANNIAVDIKKLLAKPIK